MASSEQESVLDLFPLSTQLLAEQEVSPRARALAKFVASLLPDCAVSVYTLASDENSNFWLPRAMVGEAAIHEEVITAESGLLGALLNEAVPVLRTASELRREDYPHIDTRKSLLSLACIPLIHGENLVGALEILAFEEPNSESDIQALLPAAEVAAAALSSAQTYEDERHGTFTSITRLTQLYDLEKVFSSTLEMEELLPLIGSKFSEILECQAVNIWLMQPDESVELMHQAGEDPTSFQGQVLKANEGIAGTISDNGESVCISDAGDARLVQRNEVAPENPVVSLMGTPIMDKKALVGVVEAINKLDGTPFDDDDLFTLTSLTETASTALHNAGLLMAERKVEILETLNTVSHEITSTLNLERMLQTIVNAPQAVIPYERAAIVLEQRGRFKLSAVTGLTQVNADAPDIAPLNEILQWAALSEEVIHVRQHGEEIDSEREETRAKFRKYFADSGMRGFYARPLNDDTGRVGMLAMESSDPDFLGSGAHRNSGSAGGAGDGRAAQRADVQGSAVYFRAGTCPGAQAQVHGHGEAEADAVPGPRRGGAVFPGGLPDAVARGWRCGGGPRTTRTGATRSRGSGEQGPGARGGDCPAGAGAGGDGGMEPAFGACGGASKVRIRPAADESSAGGK